MNRRNTMLPTLATLFLLMPPLIQGGPRVLRPGDANQDGVINEHDAATIADLLSGQTDYSDDLFVGADANESGLVDAADVVWTAAHADPKTISITLPLGGTMDLKQVPIGSFDMGSPVAEESHDADEGQFNVTLTHAFYAGATEVTQSQWIEVMTTWAESEPTEADGLGDNVPVYNVSWDDAQNFITTLNTYISTSGQGPVSLRLPTEAEWEFACRAGTNTRFSFGDGLGASDGCVATQERTDNMWYCGNNSVTGAKPVGGKPANALGLRDMHGNVAEWCSDWYGAYPTTAQTDPQGADPAPGAGHVVRGGAAADTAADCRSAARSQADGSTRSAGVGFRVVFAR